MDKILEIKDLKVNIKTSLGTVKAVRGIDLEVNKGEILTIVGESGSGKTILCRSIMGILPKNSFLEKGNIEFISDGKTLKNKKVSMIFQNPMTALNPTIKVGLQIVEGILLSKNISKKEAKKEAINFMELVGIEKAKERFNSYPHEFSGGMRQRIVIAIALSSEPDVLIADEPTTALDVTVQKQILNLIVDLQRKKNLSIIFVTHDLSVVANIADRVAVMYAGKIVEIGKVDEVFYDAKHPYTKALLNSLPKSKDKKLECIEGAPPSLIDIGDGDAFAYRNENALSIDFIKEPPMFNITSTHKAATWSLHPLAQQVMEKEKEGAI